MLKWGNLLICTGKRFSNANQIALTTIRKICRIPSFLIRKISRRGFFIGIYVSLIVCIFGVVTWKIHRPNLEIIPPLTEKQGMLQDDFVLHKSEKEEEVRDATKGEEEKVASESIIRLKWPVKGEILIEHGDYIAEELNGRTIHQYHVGIRIAATEGTKVKAVAEGRVAQVKENDLFFGRSVIIEHGNIKALYGNLKEINVDEGEEVSPGQEIGTVGQEALTDNNQAKSYLHFELESGGKLIDPLTILTR